MSKREKFKTEKEITVTSVTREDLENMKVAEFDDWLEVSLSNVRIGLELCLEEIESSKPRVRLF